eukprot:305270-Chlamydomonas_euryale.AAC.2
MECSFMTSTRIAVRPVRVKCLPAPTPGFTRTCEVLAPAPTPGFTRSCEVLAPAPTLGLARTCEVLAPAPTPGFTRTCKVLAPAPTPGSIAMICLAPRALMCTAHPDSM